MRGIIIGIALCLTLPAMAEEAWQSHASILAAIRQALESNFRQSTAEYEVNIAALDNRLKLPACTQPLEIVRQPGSREIGHVSLQVRCSGTPPWTLYHRAYVRMFRRVAVLRQTVKQGTPLDVSFLTVERRDVSQLHGGVLAPEDAIGRPVNRTLAAGTVLTPDHLGGLKLVRRNQPVTIKAMRPGIEISMSGIALTDGEKGQRIRVRNQESKRIVVGRVIDEGVVNVVD